MSRHVRLAVRAEPRCLAVNVSANGRISSFSRRSEAVELSVREWMIIIGVLLIVAVLLDGYRRVRSERRNRIRVTLTRQAMQRGIVTPSSADDESPPPATNSELPNGGARVVSKPRRDDLKLDQPVPVLMESVHIPPEPVAEPEPVYTEPEPVASSAMDDAAEDLLAEPAAQAEPLEMQHVEPLIHDEPEPEFVPEPEPFRPAQSGPSATEARPFPNGALPNSAAQEVLIVNVISKEPGGFKGQDLLQILLACDLRFGNMNIFHRYEKANGKGAVQFSVANLVEPGTFDLDRIDNFSTPGLCFFLTLPGPEKAVTAFNYMVETAQVLVKNLQGDLRDEGQSVMTPQTIEHYRQRIRDFERKQLTLHL